MQSSSGRTAARGALRALEWLGWAAFFAFAALFLALRFWLLPQVERYPEQVVDALSRAVGLPVTIGGLSADWDGLHPRLTVTRLRVADRDGREALALPVVEPVVSWATLLTGELRLYSLTIDGPRLTVRRGADGALSVAGIVLGERASPAGGEGRLADWILGQREIIVRNAEIEWVDELRGAPPLALRGLQLRLRNRGDLHQVGLSARPPPELGAGLELRAALRGEGVAELASWNGRVYVELGYTDLAGWRAWVDYPLDLQGGQGALRLWATFGAGKLVDATADLALAGVTARLGPELPPLALSSVAGRVQGRSTASGGYEVGARRLELVPVQGLPMRGTTFRASWEEGEPPRGTLSADALELEPLAQLAEYLPFSPELRQLLAELAPRGRVSDASLEWSGARPGEARFRARARFDGLTMNAWRAVPGFRNLSGRIEATEARGSLSLAARDAEVDLPRVFPEPRIALARLQAGVSWERTAAGGLAVRIAQAQFANGELAGSASGSYATTSEGPGTIDLTGRLERADAASLDRYLPGPGIVGERTRAWLVRSIRAGGSDDTRLRLRGDLRDFPFRDPQRGLFEIVVQVRGAEVAYAEGWPPVEDIDGELRFERDRMEIAVRRARVLGAEMRDVRADMTIGPRAVLRIAGRAEGPSAAFARFLRESPLRERLGLPVDGLDASGDGQLRLSLALPLAEPDKSEVSGEYTFAGNTLGLGGGLPRIERAAATLAFTQDSLQVRNASGRFMGGPLRVLGGTQGDGPDAVLSASGRFTVEALEPWLPEAWRGRLRGSAAYAGSVRLRRAGAPQFSVESDLAGVESALPPPLAKPAHEALLLHVALLHGADAERDRISVTLGRLLRAEFLREREGERMAVDRAAIGFHLPPGASLRLPARPVRTLLYGSLPHLDLDRWVGLLGAGAGGGGEATTVAEMSFGKLDAFGRRLEDISVKAQVRADGWSASVTSKDIAGDVVYRSVAPRALQARMARFDVPPPAPDAVDAEARATDLPDLDLLAEDFGFRGNRLGRVEIVARHEDARWRIERLEMKNPDGSLSGRGQWRTGDPGSTSLELEFQAADVGGFLGRLGHAKLVRGGSATGNATLAWNGEPTTIDPKSLSGSVRLHAEQGAFLQIEPGIGKLVSLMSLQNLPRRVVLDFGDVFSKGFQWDTIEATAHIEQGVLETKDFRMAGGAAEVEMRGRVDLAAETQDLRVRVIPGLDGSAATVTGVLVNPPAGVAALLAQKLLKNPLGQIFAYQYAITGDWDEPKVEKLNLPPARLPNAPTGD